MAKIIFSGNIGSVELGSNRDGTNNFIKFSVAERYSYFDDSKQDWVEKGVEWRDCIIWVRSENTKQLERYQNLLVVGAGVQVSGRTSIDPSAELKENGSPKYLNPYVIVSDVALTLERIDSVTYKAKSNNAIENDREGQQLNNGKASSRNQQPSTDPFPDGDVVF